MEREHARNTEKATTTEALASVISGGYGLLDDKECFPYNLTATRIAEIVTDISNQNTSDYSEIATKYNTTVENVEKSLKTVHELGHKLMMMTSSPEELKEIAPSTEINLEGLH